MSPLKFPWQFPWIVDIFPAYQKKSIIILGYCPHALSTQFMHLCERRMTQILFHQTLSLTTYVLATSDLPTVMWRNENGAVVYILQGNVWSVFKDLWIFFWGLQGKWFLNDQLIPANCDSQWTPISWQSPDMRGWVDRKKMLHGTESWLQLHGTCPGNHIRCVSTVLL